MPQLQVRGDASPIAIVQVKALTGGQLFANLLVMVQLGLLILQESELVTVYKVTVRRIAWPWRQTW